MTRAACSLVSAQELLAWWLRELDERDDARLDEHLLACPECSGRLRAIVDLGAGIRREGLRGGFGCVLPVPFIERLKTAGLRVREYDLEPGGSVACTVTRDDDLVVSYLRAPLRDVGRLDLIMHDPTVGTLRLSDVAFDPTADRIAVMPDIVHLRTLGPSQHRMQLVAIDGVDERVLADYTFDHSPS
jgi:hypothetical protein